MDVRNYFAQMELCYEQSTGLLYLVDPEDGRALVARGYAGKGVGINEPSFEERVAEGPIPRGMWRIYPPVQHERLGPVSLPLAWIGETKESWVAGNGRSGFYIHGDNRHANGTASSGCIILDRTVREWIAKLRSLGCTKLAVVR